jgi:hypothetical protein
MGFNIHRINCRKIGLAKTDGASYDVDEQLT